MTTTTTEQIPTTTWDAIAEDLLQSRHIKLLGSSVSRILLNSPAVNLSSGAATASISPSTRAQWTSAVWQHILDSDLHGLTVAGLLPMNLGSQPAAVLKEAVVVQIQTSRDATQPLRVCADTDDADVANLAAAQRSTSTRLLKLTLTDGHVEVPAIELQTLRCFRGIPTPGEKLLLAAGTEIKNGMVLLTDAHVVCLGGSERRLRDEFQMQSNHRGMRWTFANGGAEGAPKFTPLHQLTVMNCGSSSGGNGGGGSAGGARGGRGRGHAGREADTHPPTGGRGGRGAAKEAHHPQQQNYTSGPPPSLPHSLSGAGPSSPPPHDRAPYRERGRGGGAERGGGGRGGGRGNSTREGRGAGRGGGERGGGRGGGRGRGHFADPYSSPPNASSHHRPMETTTGLSAAAKPAGMPKFSDADFPELGGDW